MKICSSSAIRKLVSSVISNADERNRSPEPYQQVNCMDFLISGLLSLALHEVNCLLFAPQQLHHLFISITF